MILFCGIACGISGNILSQTTDLRYVIKSILIIIQRDATQSSLFIILQVHSTCFGCQPHPSGAHKTVTTASCTVQLPPSISGQLGHLWREVAAQKI